MRILFISDGLANGGKERQMVETIKYLKNKGYTIGVITFNENQHYSKLVSKLVDKYSFLPKKPNRLRPFATIWNAIRDFEPDIVHTWDTLSSIYCFLPVKVLGAKFIDNSIQDAGIDKGINYFAKVILAKLSDIAIGNSIAGMKYYKIHNGRLLYNAIDSQRFKIDDQRNDFNIIKASSFSDYKDHMTFLKASKLLLESRIVDKVFLAGDGKNKSKFKEYVESTFGDVKTKVHFLGAVMNIEDYLANCSIGVLCSTAKYSEGISNSLLEFMASGLVAIGTNIGGTSEIIQNNENGFLIHEGDFNAIFEIVQRVKNDHTLFARIRNNAKETINQKFSYSKNCEQLTKIYEELCAVS